ncbi:4-hydroxyphenylpyruvate dioxygenase, partial [Mucuna pruriens]
MGKETKAQTEAQTGFKLVGFEKFVRTNPKSDRFQVNRFHHIEFWCTDATNAACRFSWGLGMPIVAKSDLSTGNLIHASYLLRSGDLSFLFSAPYSPTISAANADCGGASTAAVPTFDASACLAFAAKHGFGARAIAIEVADAETAFHTSVAHGALPASPPVLLDGRTGFAEVRIYGDVVLRYISYKDPSHASDTNPGRWFLPGFEAATATFPALDYGIRRLDHAVGNVPSLAETVSYLKGFTGFHEFAEFTAEDVGTSESGLNSVVLANNSESVLLPLNEPVYGTKRRSQIEMYLEHNEGPGVQHLALVSHDIFTTISEMRKRSSVGGFEFMPSPPPTYYANLHNRASDVLTVDQIQLCEQLGILVDKDDQGTLLQIFTKPIGDRPTIFIEIIQRLGCMVEDEEGKVYQKAACGGFGKGNFSELFKSIEEYEKTLEARSTA